MDKTTTGLLFQLFIAVMLGVIASSKGFKPWNWVLACGLLGIIVLLCQRSAKDEDIDNETRLRRRRKGNMIGAYMSLATLAMIILIVALNFSMYHRG